MESSNLLGVEFKTLVISMLNELSNKELKQRDMQLETEDRKHKKEPVRNEEYNK